jgi:hypothetical protein
MSLARRARLARLTPRILKPVLLDPEERRQRLLHTVEFGLVLRETLPRLGVDPSCVAMLSRCDAAAMMLRVVYHEALDRPRPDCGMVSYLTFVSNPPPSDTGEPVEPLPDDDPLRERLNELSHKVDYYLANPAINFGSASLFEVFCWCAARLIERWLPTDDEPEDASAAEGDFAAD